MEKLCASNLTLCRVFSQINFCFLLCLFHARGHQGNTIVFAMFAELIKLTESHILSLCNTSSICPITYVETYQEQSMTRAPWLRASSWEPGLRTTGTVHHMEIGAYLSHCVHGNAGPNKRYRLSLLWFLDYAFKSTVFHLGSKTEVLQFFEESFRTLLLYTCTKSPRVTLSLGEPLRAGV